MNADFLAVLEFWEREKGINRDVLAGAVQEALLSAAKKAIGPARELRVVIDQKNGDIRAFAKLVVSEKVISKHDQISVFDARRIRAEAQLGEEVEVEVTPVGFGRIAAQYAKQALMQHIRREEKRLIFTEFKERFGASTGRTCWWIWANMRPCCPTASACQPRNTRWASGFVAMSRRSRTAPTARKSFYPAPTRAS
jgi:N utilization substance protein A